LGGGWECRAERGTKNQRQDFRGKRFGFHSGQTARLFVLKLIFFEETNFFSSARSTGEKKLVLIKENQFETNNIAPQTESIQAFTFISPNLTHESKKRNPENGNQERGPCPTCF